MTTVGPFKVITADPAWRLSDQLPGKSRGAGKNYKTMSVEEICAYPLPPLADDCLLLLWRLSSMVEEAYQVVRAWGFVPKAEVVWEKVTAKNGRPWIGMGRYTRASHETAILATRGRVQVADKGVRSRFAASVPVDERGRPIHSAKPEFFYRQVVERLSRGPFVELFSRQTREGWTTIGDGL